MRQIRAFASLPCAPTRAFSHGRPLGTGVALALVVNLALVGCAGGVPNIAPPSLPTANATVNDGGADRPLVVDWSAVDRIRLGSLVQTVRKEGGQLVVKVGDGKLELLPYCRAPGNYAYAPGTNGVEVGHDLIETAADLRAKLPTSVLKLSGAVAQGDALAVRTALVGFYRSDHPKVSHAELVGEICDGGTHVIAALSVGAFDLHAGAARELSASLELGPGVPIASAQGAARARHQRLNFAGNVAACKAARGNDPSPPEECRAPVGLELIALGSKAMSAHVAPPARPTRESVDRAVARQLRVDLAVTGMPPQAQAEIESLARTGLVVVRHGLDGFQVLPGCKLEGGYGYLGMSRKDTTIVTVGPDEAFAVFPFLGADLDGASRSSDSLVARHSTVGAYRSTRRAARRTELTGAECARATHFMTGFEVGASEVHGEGGSSGSSALNISNGRFDACASATPDSPRPPRGCSGAVRLTLAAIGEE